MSKPGRQGKPWDGNTLGMYSQIMHLESTATSEKRVRARACERASAGVRISESVIESKCECECEKSLCAARWGGEGRLVCPSQVDAGGTALRAQRGPLVDLRYVKKEDRAPCVGPECRAQERACLFQKGDVAIEFH